MKHSETESIPYHTVFLIASLSNVWCVVLFNYLNGDRVKRESLGIEKDGLLFKHDAKLAYMKNAR